MRSVCLLLVFLLLLPVCAFAETQYDVVITYTPVEGYIWQTDILTEGIVRCGEPSVTPHPWHDDEERISFPFTGLAEGSADILFFYVPEDDQESEPADAWRIGLTVDKDLNVTEALSGVYERGGFDSFDGGGPEYTVHCSDDSIVHVSSYTTYDKPDHETLTGAGYDITWLFFGRKPGTTDVTVSVSLFGDVETVDEFTLTVDEDLCVTLAGETVPEQ